MTLKQHIRDLVLTHSDAKKLTTELTEAVGGFIAQEIRREVALREYPIRRDGFLAALKEIQDCPHCRSFHPHVEKYYPAIDSSEIS